LQSEAWAFDRKHGSLQRKHAVVQSRMATSTDGHGDLPCLSVARATQTWELATQAWELAAQLVDIDEP